MLEEQEEQMLHRVFGFADLTAGQVMVPRTELVAIAADATRDEVVSLIARYGHTRLPVYREDLDHVIGILHVTDLLKAIAANGEVNVARSPGKRSRCPRRWAPTICSPKCAAAACARRS